jgi:serine/threonine protein phosphatase PrpC
MTNRIKNIVSYCHTGKREYQEDSHRAGENFLLVSDGVGGMAKADIASGIVVDTWTKALNEKAFDISQIQVVINALVIDTLLALSDYAHAHPESEGMAATVACVLNLSDQYYAIHIGDSRIYHFSKDGTIKWRSKDHSLVQELITAGVITEEAAATNPRRHMITKVLQAKEGHIVEASIQKLDNVEDMDTFMVCSDGVTEAWSDEGLSAIISAYPDTTLALYEIEKLCAENSYDNNTAVMAKVVVQSIVPDKDLIIPAMPDTSVGNKNIKQNELVEKNLTSNLNSFFLKTKQYVKDHLLISIALLTFLIIGSIKVSNNRNKINFQSDSQYIQKPVKEILNERNPSDALIPRSHNPIRNNYDSFGDKINVNTIKDTAIRIFEENEIKVLDQESKDWEEILKSPSADKLKKFLDDYPRAMHRHKAKEILKKMINN